MTTAIAAVLTYGVLCMAGGVLGYVKARSNVSLLAGLGSGLLLLDFAYEMLDGSQGAVIGSMAVAGLLGTRFLMTWLKRRRVMPDLIMVVASAVTVAAVAPLLRSP